MKFLFISSLKDVAFTVPPPVMRQLMEASLAWVNQKKKEGVILEMYELAGCNRWAVICQHESAESMVQIISTMPFNSFMNHDIHALADYNTAMKAYIESVKASEQMMPGPPG
jgi:muconolactone delta-isomerase